MVLVKYGKYGTQSLYLLNSNKAYFADKNINKRQMFSQSTVIEYAQHTLVVFVGRCGLNQSNIFGPVTNFFVPVNGTGPGGLEMLV